MAFLAPITAAITQAGPTLKLLGAGLGAVQGFAMNRYQASLASRQAAQLQQEAMIANQTAAVEAQDSDQAAMQEISDLEARQAGTGFSTGSMSFRRKRQHASLLARRDAYRIIQAGQRRSQALGQEAAAKRAESKGFKTASIFSLGEGLLDFSTGMIENAELVDRKKAGQLRRKAARI